MPVAIALASQNVTNHAPSHWLQTCHVAATPKTKQRKVSEIVLGRTNHSPGLATKSTTGLPCHEHTVLLRHSANAPHQILTQKSIGGPSVIANYEVGLATQMVDRPLQQPHIEPLSIEIVKQQFHGEPGLSDVFNSRAKQVPAQSASDAFSGSKDEVMIPTSASYQDEGKPLDAELQNLAPLNPEERGLQYRTPTLNDKDLCIANETEAHIEIPTAMRYTNRELARIALVAANGLHMTTSQIIIWLAHTFSSLRVGEGVWEMHVRSALSGSAEFQGRRMRRTHGNKKLYGFSSQDFRSQFETEYSEFSMSSKPHTTPVQDEQNTLDRRKQWIYQQPATKRTVKSVPSMSKTKVDHKPRTNNLTPHGQPNVQTKHAANEAISKPFERPTPRRASDLLDVRRSVGQETTVNTAILSVYQPTIETMTTIEKAQRLEQIKARLSRKAYFGSSHRLAHKRRHNLEDIHDERAGAWKPPIWIAEGGQRETNQDIDMDDEGNRTLRAAFNLPDNMVPINDGQTELAFKDGTKGKRSRTMYKVGKMFGGELTVRMS
jgi:hypothetical protein